MCDARLVALVPVHTYDARLVALVPAHMYDARPLVRRPMWHPRRLRLVAASTPVACPPLETARTVQHWFPKMSALATHRRSTCAPIAAPTMTRAVRIAHSASPHRHSRSLLSRLQFLALADQGLPHWAAARRRRRRVTCDDTGKQHRPPPKCPDTVLHLQHQQ